MSPKRKFRSISSEQADVIWRTVKKTPTGWKGVSRAARLIDVSRQTVYDFLQEHPEPEVTRKLQPKYIKDLKQSRGYQEILKYNKEVLRVVPSTLKMRMNFLTKCWLFLDKRDPVGWTEEDFRALQNNPKWFSHKLSPPQMPLGKLVALRNYMTALGHQEWHRLFKTKGSKPTAGAKRHWYFRASEVKAISKHMTDFSAKVLFLMACKTGNRISTFLTSTFSDLHLDVKGWETWEVIETKTDTRNTNYLSDELIDLLRSYISFMKRAGLYGADKKIFPRAKEFYTDQLRDASRRAGLCETCTHPRTHELVDYCIHGFPVTWHITRHTFASLNAQLGVPLQHIMNQGPWSDAKTLLDFYAGLDPQQVRSSMSQLKIIEEED